MEESFDGVEGVLSTVSGYSGGHLKNPTYHDVIYKDTGHVEALEITYDPNKVNFEKLGKTGYVRGGVSNWIQSAEQFLN